MRCSRSWGVRGSLVLATFGGSALLQRGQLRFSAQGLTIHVLSRRADEADVVIEVGGDTSLGSHSLHLVLDGLSYEFPNVFNVVEAILQSYSGPAARGIGSHLL